MNENYKEEISQRLSEITKNFDITTVLGQPLYLNDNRIIIPINKLIYGYGVGQSEFHKKTNDNELSYEYISDIIPYGGGIGAMNVKTDALLVIDGDKAKVIKVDENTLYDKTLDLIAAVIKKIQK